MIVGSRVFTQIHIFDVLLLPARIFFFVAPFPDTPAGSAAISRIL